jgi:hypothetical protein
MKLRTSMGLSLSMMEVRVSAAFGGDENDYLNV